MATQAKNMTVKVVISRANPGAPVTFAFDDNPGEEDRIEFLNDDHPGFFVYFKIKDVNKTGLRFRLKPKDALWVALGNQCPPDGAQWPGFIPLSVENEGRKLIVYCRNEDEEEFRFALRFRRLDGALEEDWDPIGDGLDGPRGTF